MGVVMFGSSSSQGNPNGDPELSNPPSDTVSSVAWSSKANFIVGASWDKTIRCWEVQCQGKDINSIGKAQQTAEAPILCTAWHDEGSQVYWAGCDNKAFVWDLGSNQTQQVAQHNAGIQTMAFVRSPQAGELLITGSWDKTLKFWDVRQKKD